MRDLTKMLSPKSIAIIGASNKPGSVGNELIKRSIEAKFKGKIYPINLHEEKIEGLKCYKNVGAVPNIIDLAIIAVPAKIVPSVLNECAAKNIGNVAIISSGFSETGSKSEGAKLEKEIAEFAQKMKINVLGPNCLGVINLDKSVCLNACFAPLQPRLGSIGFATQSGALASGIINLLPSMQTGLSQMVSLGNQCQIDAVDVLSAWEKSENVKEITMYLESIPDLARFRQIASRVVKKKPVIVIKSGTSKRGSQASASHTGHLAGDDTTTSGVLSSCGVIRETRIEDMFNVARVFDSCPLPRGPRVAILTNAGGPGILATDCAERSKLPLADLSERTQKRLRAVLNPQASVANPVDVIADATAEQYEAAADILLSASEVDILFVIYLYIAGKNDIEISKHLEEMRKKHPSKPIVAVFMTTENYPNEIKQVLPTYSIPTFNFVDQAMHCVERLVDRAKYLSSLRTPTPQFKTNPAKVVDVLAHAQERDIKNLSTLQSLKVFSAYGLPIPLFSVATNISEAKKAAKQIGYPVVLKISSITVTHKSDIGGVITNIKSEDELVSKWQELMAKLKSANLLNSLDGIIIMQQIKGSSRELVAGIVEQSGVHHLMFGLGGIFVEALSEIAFRPCPLSLNDVDHLISCTKAKNILGNLRGLKAVNIDKLRETLLRLSQLITDFPQIAELDANPIMIDENGDIKIVDARITI